MNSRDVTSDALETSVHTALAQAAERIIAGELPIPVRERWQPLRMGLMNLFLFEDERFPFADGRLLLRGTNGTGKSRVLAMTLPLLLDGSLKPNRVEPDRDSTRQVAWNLLMDDQSSRTGYSWLEFGRIDGQDSVEGNGSPAEAQYLTIGCGMKAVRGQPIKPWFFVTDLRVDESLELKSADGVPLTLRQLTESLADRGQVVETARDYRRLVDERLFRLGERYDPLIDLLLQLRQPQLAKKLDLEQLESALRSALPPLPESLLDDAAEAFRDLDQYRASLAADRQTLEDVTKFLRPYRDHVQRGTLRAAKRLTRANSEYEKAQRELRQATERLELNRRELQTEEKRQRELRVRLAETEAALDALKSRPEMQDAEQLDQIQQSIERQRKELAETEEDRQRSADELKTANDRREQAASELKRHQDAAAESSANATATAAPDSLVNRHRELTNPFLANGLADVKEVSSAQSKLTEDIRHWRKATEHLASRNGEVASAQGKLRDATRDTSNAKQQMDQSIELLADAGEAENAERERLWDAIVKWYQTESPLQSHLPTLGLFSDDWHRWAETLFASDPLDAVITLAEQQTERRFAQEESVLVQQFEQHELCDALLASEQRQLESGASIEPPAPYTRDDAFREQQTTGAPLWQLIDFVSDVPASERPNWEAALESSGLLDAWLSADGTLSDANGQDTQLAIADEPALPLERQLRRVLRVTENCTQHGVSASIVDALLTVIGVGEGAGRIWVDRDGRWQNGPLHGCWTKPLAQFVGDDARTQWRAVRLAEIVVEREHIQIEMTRANARIEEINGLRIQVVEHRTRVPSTTALFQRHADTNAKQTQLDQASQRHRDCETVEQEHRDRVTSLIQRRDQDAADLGLTGWVEKLDELRQRLGDYESKLQVFWAMLESLASAYIRLDEAGQRLDNSSKQQQMLQRRRDDKQIELTKDEVKYRELNAATGQAVAEIMRRLEAQRAAKKSLDDDVERCNQQIIAHHSAIGGLESKLQQFEETSQKSDELRHDAADWFGTIGSHGMIDFAIDEFETLEQPWSMTQAIKLARSADIKLQGVRTDDDGWQSSQNRVYEEHTSLQQTVLSQDGMGTDVDHLRDGLMLVTISMQSERLSLADAVSRLKSDIAERDRILDEKEQETLEKYLLGEVADGLRKKMQLAAELIDLMTREVSRRPMKTGMQLRFKWQRDPEGPPGLAEACDVLRTVSATWSPDEREQIKLFLQRRIRMERSGDHIGSWHDHLREALDYRGWHRIEIFRRSGPDAEWKRLTRRTYGSGSGGEKAIALTLPQLAAAAAYYKTADKHAPRFILLDEAFAGISSDMRESCMELITAFDLDVVMTSENEWGCYAGVPQIAICQLDRFAGIDAVVTRTFVWNGKQKRAVIDPEVAAERERQPLLPD